MLPSDTMIDRRRWARYPAYSRVKFRLSAPGKELFYRGHVEDISRGGLKLRVDRQFETGTVGKVLFDVPLEARVVYVSNLCHGNWALGCAFAQELAPEELIELRKTLS
jgi:hypothetical protein